MNEKAIELLERAMRDYNTSIKILNAQTNHENIKRAHGALKRLRGLTDMLFATTGVFVTFDYIENGYFSEISAYNYTITKVN